MTRRDRYLLVLPCLVAVAPVVHLWSMNAAITEPVDAVSVVGVLLVLTAIPLGAIWGLTRDDARSAITVALAWLPILTFGYQVDLLPERYPDLTLALALIANAALTFGLIALVWRRDVRKLAAYATFAAALFIGSTVPGLAFGVSLTAAPTRTAAEEAGEGPDIYFIILDAYGRSDVLAELLGHDNDPFLDGLRARGFYVAGASYSNYAMTQLSLAATLNMRYLDRAAPYEDAAVDRLLEGADVIHLLQRRGYRYVHFETEWWGTQNAPLADVVYRQAGWGATEFQRVFIQTTLPGRLLPLPARHEAVLATFDQLTKIPSIRGPTFTFAHLLVPHPPYMFDSDGSVLPYRGELGAPFADSTAYIEQLNFVNREVERTIDAIIAASDKPPVILLQGDHGPAFALSMMADANTVYWERHAILNAMLVPESVRADLYPSVSPVNTFRVILRELFGHDLPTLADRSFYNWYFPHDSPGVADDPLKLREVTDLLPRE